MPLHLHISDYTADSSQTSLTNTPRKINFLLHNAEEETEYCHKLFVSALSSLYCGGIPLTWPITAPHNILTMN